MTLGFSQQINGKPNYFVEKILAGLHGRDDFNGFYLSQNYKHDLDFLETANPKLHTIRIDYHNRWKAGKLIHPVINNRTAKRFQFAPTLKCVSVQEIEIIHSPEYVTLFIDKDEIETLWVDQFSFRAYSTKADCPVFYNLSINDGFEDISGFLEYFNKDFKGKIIHWTNLKY